MNGELRYELYDGRYVKDWAKDIFKVIIQYGEGSTFTNTEIKQSIKYHGDTSDIGLFIWFLENDIKVVDKQYAVTGRKAMGSGRYYFYLTEYGQEVKEYVENE